MKTFIALCLLACAATVFAAAPLEFSKDNGKIVDLKYGRLAPWYKCPSKGNHPHPYMCDHFMACTTHNGTVAYELPCQMGHGERLWYVRDSGPDEGASYCDYPAVVDCDLSGKCPRNGTTRQTGDECDIDCDQCSWCELEDDKPVSYYWRCQRDSEPDSPFSDWKGTWSLERCADGTLVDKRVSLANSLVGGLCTGWGDLHKDTKDDYKNPLVHPECQREEPCEYGQNEGDVCSGNYWYKKEGSDVKEDKKCEGDLKWSQGHENCKPCGEVASCAGKC